MPTVPIRRHEYIERGNQMVKAACEDQQCSEASEGFSQHCSPAQFLWCLESNSPTHFSISAPRSFHHLRRKSHP